jgi:hypothetical protein
MGPEGLPKPIHSTDFAGLPIDPVDVFGILIVREGRSTLWAQVAMQDNSEIPVALCPLIEIYVKLGVNGRLSTSCHAIVTFRLRL